MGSFVTGLFQNILERTKALVFVFVFVFVLVYEQGYEAWFVRHRLYPERTKKFRLRVRFRPGTRRTHKYVTPHYPHDMSKNKLPINLIVFALS